MKNILVLYYTQTGQLSDILNGVLQPLKTNSEIALTYYAIKPKIPYPFPWTAIQFFDAFPETVLDIPCELDLSDFNKDAKYDLIILGYQVWYLSPSIPISSFLKTTQAEVIFKNTPVVTVIGCRNMWLMAQEKMKSKILFLKTSIVGNIVFFDKAPNIISVVTISAWLIGGKREGFMKIFPRSGVSYKDVKESSKFGNILLENIKIGDYADLQLKLNTAKAIIVKPNLMLLEKRGSKSFKVWAKFVRNKGNAGDKRRFGRVRLFATVLPVAILLLTPVKAVSSFLILKLTQKKIKKEIQYFSQNSLRK